MRDIRNFDILMLPGCKTPSRVTAGRRFTCRDPEGHIWSITYDPWQAMARRDGDSQRLN